MAHEYEGKLIKKLPKVEIPTKKGGTFTQGGFVIETMGDYPKSLFFKTVREDVADFYSNIKIGQLVKVSFNGESREWNERWYTDLVAWRIKPLTASNDNSDEPAPEKKTSAKKNVEAENESTPEEDDDLPF
jgi:hypothetical protein